MEALKYLLSAYFHQDFILDGGESSDTVAAFANAERRELVTDCADDIDRLLGDDLADGELATLLKSWGSDYRAGDTDAEYREWLTEVRDQIRSTFTT